jgi:hypothetical protein
MIMDGRMTPVNNGERFSAAVQKRVLLMQKSTCNLQTSPGK